MLELVLVDDISKYTKDLSLIEEDKVYYDRRAGFQIHRCPCERKHVVMTEVVEMPMNKILVSNIGKKWNIHVDDDSVFLHPSFHNRPCNTHYFIRWNEFDLV